MTDSLKNRWIIVGLIWVGVLILTYWNSDEIDLINHAKENEEILLRDRQFWKDNAENISGILKKGELAFHRVESVKLGLLSVKNQMISLATKNGLTDVKMDGQPDKGDESGIPVELSFKGSFEGAMAWLDVFEQDYPYLKAKSLKIVIDQSNKQTEFDLSFYYRYKTSFPENGT